MSPVSKAARRKPKKRAVAKRARRKASGAPRRAARKTARKPARKVIRGATRKPARKAVRKTARKTVRKPARRKSRPAPARRERAHSAARPVRGKPAPRPRLRVVRSPRHAGAPPPASFPQRGGASAKQLLLFELIRARAAVLAAIQGLTPGSANLPMGEGQWSVRETVLHLVTRDQARLRESEATRHGQPPSWKGVTDEEMSRINAETLAPLAHLDWDEAIRLLHRVHELLVEEVESVPDTPAEIWSPEHPFGWMLHRLPPHDRHHADLIKRWRTERGV